MGFILRVIITSFFVLVSYSQPQQKEYFISKEVPIPDSLKAQVKSMIDSLLSNEIDSNKVRQGWPKLQTGMTPFEVRKLLGKPSKIEYDHFYETWYYDKLLIVFDKKIQSLVEWHN